MADAPVPNARLTAGVVRIETCLDELDAALASGEAARIETQAQTLHRALTDGLAAFQQSGASPHAAPATLTPDLRQRLQQAQARAQAQQQAVHRVLASTGRVLTALFPQNENETYAALGQTPSARAVGKAYR